MMTRWPDKCKSILEREGMEGVREGVREGERGSEQGSEVR